MNRGPGKIVALVGIMATFACSPAQAPPPPQVKSPPALPPAPTVTYSPSSPAGAQPGQSIEHGELILREMDHSRRLLHRQHHPHSILETRRLPGPFKPPAMKSIKDFALSKKDLVVTIRDPEFCPCDGGSEARLSQLDDRDYLYGARRGPADAYPCR